VSLAAGVLQSLRGGRGIHRNRVVGEEELPDRLPHREGVRVLFVGRLDEVVDQALLGEPQGELVGCRDPVDPRLEVQRVHVVADEVEWRM
jgi:hypothetical protein